MGEEGLGISLGYYSQLPHDLKTSIDVVSQTVDSLQDQLIDSSCSPPGVFGVFITEKGGYCAMLEEECCYFVNKSGIVKGQVKLRELALELGKRYAVSNSSPWSSWWPTLDMWAPVLMPIQGPPFTVIFFVCLLLLLVLCTFKLLS